MLRNYMDASVYFQATDKTTRKKLDCKCTHTTTFSGGFVVQPNTIDFGYVFANMDFMSNPTLYITIIFVGVVYLLAVVWARRKDIKDLEKV